MSVYEEIAKLGIELPAVAKPVAAYVPAKKQGNIVQTSGQLPMVAGQLVAVGKVGNNAASTQEANEAARLCAINALAAIASVCENGLDDVLEILHLTVFVNSEPDFTEQPLVANGASEICKTLFADQGAHTRSAVGVAALPLNAMVEVEMRVLVK